MKMSPGVDLRRDGVGRLMFRLAAPAILAQVINALYNIVDRIYIGRLPEEISTQCIAALGISLPLIVVISAFGTMIGVGGSALAAIRMGEKKNGEANRILNNCLPPLIGLSVVICILCQLFCRDLLLLVGATENIIDYAVQYFQLYAWGTLPVLLVLGLNPFINTQGLATTSMLTVLIGAVTNIVLDPILIFGFDLGVCGAAIATVISQSISAIWVVCFLCGKKTRLRLRISEMRVRWSLLGPVLALGISPFIMNSTESLVGIVINVTIRSVSPDLATAETYLGAYTIIASVMQLVMLPLTGLGQGAQPIISYNYGARQCARVKQAYFLFLRCCLVFTGVVCISALLFPTVFVRLFNNDPALLEATVPALRIYICMVTMFGVQSACQQTFLATGQAKISLFLALLRKVILLIPLIFLFSRFWGILGIFIAEPVADTLAATSTATVFYLRRKSIFETPAGTAGEELPAKGV